MGKEGGKSLLREAIKGAKEAMFLEAQIEIVGNSHAVIQGAKGIVFYEEDSIRIKLADQDVLFYGSKLSIESLSSDSMEIKGKIIRIEYL